MAYPFHGRRLARAMVIDSIYNSELMGIPLDKAFEDVVEERREFFQRIVDDPKEDDVKSEKQLERFKRDLENWDSIVEFGRKLLEVYKTNRDQIEEIIRRNIVGIDYDRIFNVEKSILKAATAEMLGLDTDYKVVITEAVRIANELSTEKAAKMINAILDKIALDIGLKEEKSEQET